MYSLEQLSLFVTVYEQGSFSAAARKLRRAQSGVSQAIAHFEIAINHELFSRDNNQLRLTDTGKALLPIAKSILQQRHYFDQKVQALEQEIEHELVMAVDESLLDSTFCQMLTSLAERFPVTNIECISTSTFEVESLVRSGRAHIGIGFADGELRDDMDFFILGQARFLTICAPNHPLAELDSVTDWDLKKYCQCVYRNLDKQETWFTYGISSYFWYANNHQTLINLVAKGIGWANVPKISANHFLKAKEITHLSVEHEKNGWLTTVGCLVSRTQAKGPALSALLRILHSHQFTDDCWQQA